MTQGLLVLNDESYIFKRWHGTLLFAAVILVSVLFNTVLARALPVIESCILVCHVVGFFALIIPLVMLAPQSTPSYVFTEFDNKGGWSNDGLAWSVGLISSAYPFICMYHSSSRITSWFCPVSDKTN
jgi:choline transport protein